MAIQQKVFKVVTDFRFETGNFVADSGAVKSAIDGISSSADQALFSFQKLSLGVLASFMSGPGGGLLGFFATAAKNADSFKQSQIGLANVLGAGAGSFADRMTYAKNQMEDIARLASSTGISGKALVNFTKTMTPALKGKLGASAAVNQSKELGRVFLKSAPSLGIDPHVGMAQLRRLTMGLQTTGNQMFTILTQDTKAMARFIGKGKEFKALHIAEKMQFITKAFTEFAQGDAVNAVTNTLTGQLNILRENFMGVGSVLRPLGDVVNNVLIEALKKLNDFIAKTLGPVLKNIAFALEPFSHDLERLGATLYQLSQLSRDAGKAMTWMMRVVIGTTLAWAFKKLGIQIPIVSGALRVFSRSLNFLEADLLRGAKLNYLRGSKKGGFVRGVAKNPIILFFNNIFKFITRSIAPLILLVGVFQLFSRALAVFKIHAAKKIAGAMGKLSRGIAIFVRIFAVFDKGFQRVAEWLAVSFIFDALFWGFEKLMSILEFLGTVIGLAMASFQGITFFLLEFAYTVVSIFKIIVYDMLKVLSSIPGFGGLSPGGEAFRPKLGGAFGGDVFAAFTAGTDEMFADVFGAIGEGTVLANQTVNQKINMNNTFKENLQPDRIAFSLTKQLLSVAQNGKTAHGRPQRKARVG